MIVVVHHTSVCSARELHAMAIQLNRFISTYSGPLGADEANLLHLGSHLVPTRTCCALIWTYVMRIWYYVVIIWDAQ